MILTDEEIVRAAPADKLDDVAGQVASDDGMPVNDANQREEVRHGMA